MLKTSIEKAAQPDVITIAKGILKGYIKNTNIFILKMLLRFIGIRKKINKNIPNDINRLLALVIAMYFSLRKRFEKDQALAMVKAVIIPIGIISQMSLFRYVEDTDHSFENLKKYSKCFKKEGPMRLNRMTIEEESPETYRFTVHNCLFKSVFNSFSCPELLGVFCAVDNATYSIYSPDSIVFSRGGTDNTIAKNNKTCIFICTNKGHSNER
ncbi:L-2-amino-thiazoline-4-carboxylic acid hydrolase [Marispirochaeta sp.]|uniref:L-2-amino-thiazoline-4-carboxylic acid hydrolase n=1 Tax=Marispirochaeta sp. TaxID=2038653 RepID=UPI0029C8CAB4|nr:L-2-amino-thiazoline-4-carboxylic acid hydrolase [Marispirochaeta sp.]